MGYLRKGDPKIMASDGYGVLKRLPRATVKYSNTSYITKLFVGSDVYA